MTEPPRRDSPESSSPGSLRGGRYRVLGVLGSGSQGETFDAEDTTRGARVAIKRFSVRGARSWKDVELAEREARVLSRLEHPNLPRYVEHFEEDGALYLVTEKIEGRTLGELRRARLGLGEGEVLRFLADAGEALGYLHGRAPPLIHRDIKPNNVIARPDGSFALVDFGSVRDRLRPEGGSTVVGTFGYMAPEQFQGRALPATDVYGVGATAIACLTGEEPEDLPHQGLAIDVPRALGARADPRLVRLLSELLEPDPDRRAPDLSAALERHLGHAAAFGAPPRPSQAPPRSRRAEPESEFWSDWRSERRRERSGPELGQAVLLVVMLGLFVARFATFGLFRLALPLLLGFLALFFGKGLRRAAKRMTRIGLAGDEGLRRAARAVRGTPPPDRSERSRRSERFRVEEPIDAEADEFDFEDERRERRRERKRSRRARR